MKKKPTPKAKKAKPTTKRRGRVDTLLIIETGCECPQPTPEPLPKPQGKVRPRPREAVVRKPRPIESEEP
jgi:hypothetical protein